MGRANGGFLLLWNEQKRLLGDAFLPTYLYAWDWVPPDNGATLSADSLVMLCPVLPALVQGDASAHLE